MPEPLLHVAVIVGSTRTGRLGSTVARWFARQCEPRTDLSLDLIELAEVDLPAVLGSRDPAVVAYVERIDRADAIVVVTPEYNHGYPASLKQAIDVAHAEWHAKPVGFVSYGGISGGLRAVEQLRQVFAEVHAVTIRDSVSFAGAWEQFDAEGTLRSPERASKSMATMLGRLHWW